MLTQAAIRSAAALANAGPACRAASALPAAATDTGPLAQHMRLMGAAMSFPRNAEIFGENEPADYLYKLIGGTVRTYKILSDGRRQISGFYLPGDVFGFEFGEEHSQSAEAITAAKVLVIKRSALTALAGRDAAVGRELYALTGRELRRVQDRIPLLIKNAQERVASFLLEMAERAPCGDAVELPMSRQDIADYLGLTIETVSRTLTTLESAAAIEVPTSRRIVLRNRQALKRLNG
jgi:CRP/FNR family transcriptional regulator, nitrogen fixation regulation protein